jgi:hypothetical protein
MTPKRPIILSIVAWIWIVVGSIGGLFNVYGFVASIPGYPRWIWAALLVAKLGSVFAGILLLKMKKAAALVYVATAAYGWALALGFTNHYTPVSVWRYAVGLIILAIYAAIFWRHWSILQPQNDAAGVTANA